MNIFNILFTVFIFSFILFHSKALNVTHDSRSIIIDGNHRIILSGSIHYPRSTAQMWSDLIRKAKEGGLDAVETYVFWNAHEPARRQYDFSGNLDLIRFLKTVQDQGLMQFFELDLIPVRSGIMEKLFASQGGNIILAQVENEYGNVMEPYGDDGKSYINWCAQMADSFDIGVPWIMCQQAAPPKPTFKSWGGAYPFRTAEDLAYSYHGGTNCGRTSGGPYITTTYDYNAPLDEYGNLNQPTWGHLKELHDVLHSIEYTLTNGEVKNEKLSNLVMATIYETKEKSSCFLSNTNTKIVQMSASEALITLFQHGLLVSFQIAGRKHIIPLRQTPFFCFVSAQTSLMVKKLNKAEDEPSSLKWMWRPELIESASVQGRRDVSLNKIVDQKDMANDATDYLWYMTSIDVAKDDPVLNGTVTLCVNDTGHVLHAFFNGEYIGSQWSKYVSLLDLVGAGITSPIELVLNKNVFKDLSSNKWTYKVGLNGISNKFFNTDCASKSSSRWISDPILVYKNFAWYKVSCSSIIS
ncbi:beta-galactosidase 15-like [Gossypium australe]|uniref:beta-galactosidase n=1 Tax=Gossypium australe TaxID=47621 RepID=A0A5B6WZ22_9ROSI|nr:beta-galactosidase 15-like [Gossypium australe]